MRVDPQDNVWIVDQMSTQVIKFDPNGRVQMILSRKPEAMNVPRCRGSIRFRRESPSFSRFQPAAGGQRGGGEGGGEVAARRRQALARRRSRPVKASIARPTLRGTPPATSTSPTATATRAWRSTTRTASGSRTGARAEPDPGQFNIVHGIAIDAQGNVYVGRRRKQAHPGVRRRRELQDAVHQRRHADGDLHHARDRSRCSTSRTPAIPTAWRTPRSTRSI